MTTSKKLIYIEWLDAIANPNWFDADMAEQWIKDSKMVIKQAGWLIKETKQYICIAGAYKKEDENTSEQYNLLQKIPKPWIIKRKEIKL